jgi:deoxycytidylate deaminase
MYSMAKRKKHRRMVNKLTIYIARFTEKGSPRRKQISGHSAPCKTCTEKIKQLGIKKIVYVDRDGKIISCKTKNYFTEFVSSGYRCYKLKNIAIHNNYVPGKCY